MSGEPRTACSAPDEKNQWHNMARAGKNGADAADGAQRSPTARRYNRHGLHGRDRRHALTKVAA